MLYLLTCLSLFCALQRSVSSDEGISILLGPKTDMLLIDTTTLKEEEIEHQIFLLFQRCHLIAQALSALQLDKM